jgi:hypothetical protein
MVPIIGLTIIAFSLLLVFTPMSSYLVNAFETQAASALVANTLRSILSAVFPLAGRGMYSTLEIGWGNSLLGFIALALCPGPIVVYIYIWGKTPGKVPFQGLNLPLTGSGGESLNYMLS